MKIPGLRSPHDKVGGLVYFGRMLDKIRLHEAGQLPADYVANLGERDWYFYDARCCRFLGVKHSALVKRVKRGGTDAQILRWCFQQGGKRTAEQIAIWSTFLAKRGWPAFGIDKERTLIARAIDLARRHRAPARFHLMDVMWGPQALPRDWPARYGVVLDRFCVNNVVNNDVTEEAFYGVVASLLEPGGLLILRDRANDDDPEASVFDRLHVKVTSQGRVP